MRPVDSSLIITALQAAEDRVAIGARQIWKQRRIVSRLEREGEDTTEATALLREMQRRQESHTAHRDQLRAKLAVLKEVAERGGCKADWAFARLSPLGGWHGNEHLRDRGRATSV